MGRATTQIFFGLAALALLGALPARAQDKCGPLQLVNTIQMIRLADADRDLVPITINGVTKNFLFNTGGAVTQIQRAAANDLKLQVNQGNLELFDVTGKISRDQAFVRKFVLGKMSKENIYFPITPVIEEPRISDGIFAPDYLERYDADVDFGTDKLNFFSQDHCPGHVQYWAAPALAVVPIILQGTTIVVPVTVDGHNIRATIDTGSTNTIIRIDVAKDLYGLTMGNDDTPEGAGLNGDASLKTYEHVFKSLSFQGVAVSNPRMVIIPNAMGRNADRRELTGDHTRSERDLINTPELTIGMDVLRKLHIYMAFGERKMYITQASEFTPEAKALQASLRPPAVTRELYKRLASQKIAAANQKLASDPNNAETLNDRCWWRATAKTDLDAALADCDQAVKLKPGNAQNIDSRAFVLYQQGKYQDALDGYNAALNIDPKSAPSLFMRGHTRGKLGDQSGGDADVAAATAAKPDIQKQFQPYDISY